MGMGVRFMRFMVYREWVVNVTVCGRIYRRVGSLD